MRSTVAGVDRDTHDECTKTDTGEAISPTPAQDLELAHRALNEGDPAHAAHHLAAVLGVHPIQQGIEEALDHWLTAVDDPLALVPLGERVYCGTAILRARVLHHLGRTGEAIPLALRSLQAAPGLPLTDLVSGWLGEDAVRAEHVDAIGAAANDCIPHRHIARALLPALRSLLARHGPNQRLSYAIVRAARNEGELDLAVATAEDAYRKAPSWLTASARGLAHRAKGDVDHAVQAFRDAAAHDPDDITAWLDIGDIALDARRIALAEEAYDTVLGREPRHPWALPSRLYLRWRYDGDRAAVARLRKLAAAADASPRAVALAEVTDVYATRVMEPDSATVNGVRHLLATKDPIVRMGLSCIEAPTTRLIAHLAAASLGAAPPEISVGPIPSPDPRLPRRRVEWAVWTYKEGPSGAVGETPRPAVAPAPPDVAASVASMAASPYGLAKWRLEAKPIAAALGRDPVGRVFGVMAHPPPCPRGIPLWEWVFRTQLAAALVVSVLDQGWEGSTRKRALEALFYGPVDWTSTAAMVAMTELARAEPEHASAVLGMLLPELDGEVNPVRWSCIVRPLLLLLERLPIDDATARRLAGMRRQWDPTE
jgi:hypothetical protein